MIESITIAKVATYPNSPEHLTGLSKFNFLYGSNAAGKTTISRVIADESSYPTCQVAWKSGTKLQPLVYNYDFVEKNFTKSDELKGVFTLGEKEADTLKKIKQAKDELDNLNLRIVNLANQLQGDDGNGGKLRELADIEGVIKVKCWNQKQKHDAKLKGAFEGYRNNAGKFKKKVLDELASNTAAIRTLADLENMAANLFGPPPKAEALIASVTSSSLVAHETNPILKKLVIGKEDVDIAEMIKKLGNSDWVREGRQYYEKNDDYCPFCQQHTLDEFSQSLNAYFDANFEKDIKAVEDLAKNYATDVVRLQDELAAIISSKHLFVNVLDFKEKKELLDAKIKVNLQRLDEKTKEASRVVELESLESVLKSIETMVDSVNVETVSHNRMVLNLEKERSTLTSQVWKFVLEELKADLEEYGEQKSNRLKAIEALKDQISATKKKKVIKENELRELEKKTTSIQPTIDGINHLLNSFGFQGFKLAKAESSESYKLIRPDGTDAKSTLSEGEKTFVTFLYFYHLLKGSESDTGMTLDRIVVFDDPVSSLDSDILFIVGSLIKGVLEEVRAESGHIKQVFVLTHNVYFHKEVTYNPNRRGVAMNEETFWIVRRIGLVSKVNNYPTNPIKTSYELLWAEVRTPDRANLAIQNTMRRILENYFKILGGVEFDELCEMFEGKEKLICKSLCSWVHDGSHYAHDDMYVSIDDSMVENYLKVFRDIFYKSGHKAHYKMMMGEAFDELPVSSDAT